MRRFLVSTLAAVSAVAAALITTAPAHAQYGDARSAMNDLQRNALKDGCWKRYSGNQHKRYQCLNGQAHWKNALIDGCHQRYSGNGSKLDRCLNMSNLGSGYYGGGNRHGGYYGNDPYDDRHYDDDPYGYDPYGNRRHRDGYYGNDPYYGSPNNSQGGYYGNNNSGGGFFGGGGASGLTDIQQNALKDGCWQRYSGNERKRYACLRGEAHWRDALRDGCWKRYNGNRKKLNRCLSY